MNRDRRRLVAEQFLRPPRQAVCRKTFATIRRDLRFLSRKRHQSGEPKRTMKTLLLLFGCALFVGACASDSDDDHPRHRHHRRGDGHGRDQTDTSDRSDNPSPTPALGW
jgi:hypothetical protein